MIMPESFLNSEIYTKRKTIILNNGKKKIQTNYCSFFSCYDRWVLLLYGGFFFSFLLLSDDDIINGKWTVRRQDEKGASFDGSVKG